MSNKEFFIGKSDFNRSSGSSSSGGQGAWFYLKDNTDNVYRVLPPLFSLANNGQYSKWFAVHRGLRGTNNRQYPFLCTEETDRKTKVITRQCAICNKRREQESKLEVLKQSGASKDQIQEFNLTQVFPYISERKYYVNVINQENKIGLLAIGSKMNAAFDALCKQWESKGYDLTGMTGLFANFKVAKRFKGDKDAVHSTEIFMQAANDGSFRPITHEITADVIVRLKSEASDLATIFKELPADQMEVLAAANAQQRGLLVDKIFSVAEKANNVMPATALNTQVPGTGATLVGRTEVNGGDVKIAHPDMPKAAPAPTPNQNGGSYAGLNNTAALATNNLNAAPANKVSQLSDEDFYAMMGTGKK